MSNQPNNGMRWLLTPLEGAQYGSSSIDGMGSGCSGCRDCGDCHVGGRMNTDSGPRLRDIVILLLFAILLRFAESFDKDTPGWWLEGEKGDE